MKKLKSFLFLLIFIKSSLTENSCYREVYEFTAVHPKNLSNTKLINVESEVLPYFQKKCPYFLELDDYEVALYKELNNRSLIDSKEL